MAIPAEAHSVYLYDTGGQTRIGMITPTSEVKWERVNRDISSARVTTINPDPECCRLLGQIEPGRHELVIYRGRERVWEGPVMRAKFTRDGVVIYADDVLRYTYRTILRRGYDDSATPRAVEDRARLLLETELARREIVVPINVVPYIQTYNLGQTRQARTILTYQKLVYEELEDLATEAGLCYTAVGRRIVLWDRNDDRLGRTATLTEADFAGEVNITAYGMELATFAAVTNGEGAYGYVGERDPYYGLWEILITSRPEGAAFDEPPDRDAMREQARLALAGRNPTPTRLNVPANSTLDPRAPVTMDQLVPGVRVPIRAELACRDLVQEQVLDSVEVTEDADGEKIRVTLAAAPNTAADLPSGGDDQP